MGANAPPQLHALQMRQEFVIETLLRSAYKEALTTFLGEDFMMLAQIATQTPTVVSQTGIGLGSAIAVVCSWQRSRSILWAIPAGILSWLYVIYFALTRKADETK